MGDRLRSERRRLGLSQTDFGRLGSISRRTQATYEAGQGAPSTEYLMALDRAGVDVLFVVTGREAAPAGVREGSAVWNAEGGGLSRDEAELVALFRRLRASDREALHRLAVSLAAAQ